MTDLPHDQSIDDWIAFAHDHDDDGEGDRGSWRHPAVYAAIAIGLLVVLGLVLFRPTGDARAQAEAERSAIGLPTDFFDAEVSEVNEGPCPFVPEQDCVRVSFEILEGPDAGRTYMQTFPAGGTTPDFTVGQRVVLSYRAPNARVLSVTTEPCSYDPSFDCLQVEVVMTSGDLTGDEYTIEVGEVA